jgi:hypothetical protein
METQTAATTWLDTVIIAPLQALMEQLGAFVPQLLGALLILGIGLAVAQVVERVVVRVLKTVTLDKLADQIQLSAALAKGGIRYKLSELVGKIIYWLVALAVVVAALNALNLTVAAELIQVVVSYLPKVVAALFILILGIFAANFLAATVRTVASNAGILQSNLLAQLVQTVIVILAAVTALRQLELQLFGEVLLIILGGISLGLALAFGLGCKDIAGRWASDIVDQIQGRKR